MARGLIRTPREGNGFDLDDRYFFFLVLSRFQRVVVVNI